MGSNDANGQEKYKRRSGAPPGVGHASHGQRLEPDHRLAVAETRHGGLAAQPSGLLTVGAQYAIGVGVPGGGIKYGAFTIISA